MVQKLKERERQMTETPRLGPVGHQAIIQAMTLLDLPTANDSERLLRKREGIVTDVTEITVAITETAGVADTPISNGKVNARMAVSTEAGTATDETVRRSIAAANVDIETPGLPRLITTGTVIGVPAAGTETDVGGAEAEGAATAATAILRIGGDVRDGSLDMTAGGKIVMKRTGTGEPVRISGAPRAATGSLILTGVTTPLTAQAHTQPAADMVCRKHPCKQLIQISIRRSRDTKE